MTRSAHPSWGQSGLHRWLVMLAVLLMVLAAWPAAAADDPPGSPPELVGVDEADGGGEATVTLITGDRVRLEVAADGRSTATVVPAPRPDGVEPEFTVLDTDDGLYVTPSDVQDWVPEQFDRELFNVTKLVEYEYTDGVPVIVSDAPAMQAMRSESDGIDVTHQLDSVDGYAGIVEPDGAWWAANAPAPAAGGFSAQAAGRQKVWLDELMSVTLAESVPMVGAPQAWSQGLDGTGTTVAVLDTGIDSDHPDIVGQVADARNFTSDQGISDEHGHGTHVASTIAGTGAGSDGAYTGVAPGADLLIGKICNSGGTCPTSGTLAAMEWAAPRADVINMSIGSNFGTDGTTVTALAVDDLAADHPDTLFVIAAGNNGGQGKGSIASPGAADAALTVGAVTKSGDLAGFSSVGPRLNDAAIKPDVTAPGVGIVAARGAGTSMGAPVNDLYTRANGTSMATPHVAGAAAILNQADPSLTGQQVKATLATTATPNPDLTVYEQGGGLIDIPAAIAAPVVASPAPLNLGFFQYPQVDVPVTEEAVTWTNRTGQDVTLDLALHVTDEDGAAVSATTLSVSPATVTVPANGTTTATVSLDVNGLPAGEYGGYLTATHGADDLQLSVGFFVEPEMAELRVEGTQRDGRPATRHSSMYVVDAHDPTSGFEQMRFEDGVATARFRPGTYYLVGQIWTMDGDDRYTNFKTMIGAPTIRLEEDTTLNFDARDAGPVTAVTPDHPEASPVGQKQKTVVGYGGQRDDNNFAPQYIGSWKPVYVLESGPAEVGELEFTQRLRYADPLLELSVVSPDERDLYIYPLPGTPDLDASMDLELVDVGEGAEADYDGLDVEGKAVLVLRTNRQSNFSAVEATARTHGAKAVIVRNYTSGYTLGAARGAEIPTMAITGEDGEQLLADLAAGTVVVNVSGTSWSSYLYDLTLIHTGNLPNGLTDTVDTDELVAVHNSFHGEADESMAEYRTTWRPYQLISTGQASPVKGAHERTEYVSAGDGSLYRQVVSGQWPLESRLQERDTTYPEVTEIAHEWFRGVMRPKPFEPAGPRNPGEPVQRTGDSLRFRVLPWNDSSVIPHHGFRDSTTDSVPTRFWVDDTYLGQASAPNVFLNNLPAEESQVRVELESTRTADWWQTSTQTLTNWTFHTARADEPAVVPLLIVDYDTDVDLTNTALLPRERRGPATLDLQVRHHVGFTGAEVAGVKVWISYDDGATWEQRPVMQQLGEGRFQAILDSPAAGDTPTGYATVKVEAWDTADNRIEQEVTRAWRLADR